MNTPLLLLSSSSSSSSSAIAAIWAYYKLELILKHEFLKTSGRTPWTGKESKLQTM